jgi:uncharacterized damage-inducible protein DinB
MAHYAIQNYNYHVWANQRVFEHLKKMPPEIYRLEIQSVFKSVVDLVIHIFNVDNVWLSVMKGLDFVAILKKRKELQDLTTGKSIEEIETLYSALVLQYESFFAEVVDLDKILLLNHPKFGELTLPLSEIVRHVVNHGTYHRGNLTAMLRQMGHEGVPTDYIHYLYAVAKG